ncbi:transglutaminase-like domain-containing protein [Youxingia wuxianensis]|nr:transglutaminase-like domain-containing protein [Youxingia wuxianensis]
MTPDKKIILRLAACCASICILMVGCAAPQQKNIISQADPVSQAASSPLIQEPSEAEERSFGDISSEESSLAQEAPSLEGSHIEAISSLAALSVVSSMEIKENTVPRAARPVQTTVLTPSAPGTTVYSNSKASIDASNTSEGYIAVKYTGSVGKIKLQITRSGGTTYTYNLKGSSYEYFPLTGGNGTYSINVYENVYDSQYALALAQNVEVSLRGAFLPYLYPSQYVNFNANSTAVAQGAALANGASTDLDVVQSVYNYVVTNISYDYNKAATVKSGYLPSPDSTLSSKTGICFDYAALMATMLRTQNIPTRLEVGYVTGGTYHAWISVYLTEQGWVNGIIYFDGQSWKLMDPTFASNANSSPEIMSFIENTANYQRVYVY